MKGFYVDLVRGGRIALIAGPFPSEVIARKYESPAVKKALEVDPWAHFDPHGVVAYEADKLPEGRLNGMIEIEPGDLLLEAA